MGLSPYDKKSYKESKRRRRQALLEGETGYIIPYKRSKKPLVVIVSVILALAIAAAVVIPWLVSRQKTEEAHKASLSLTDEELLQVVDRSHPLEQGDVPELSEVSGVQVNAAIAPQLTDFLSAAGQQKTTLTIKQGYVSFANQQKLYEANLAKYNDNPDYTPVRAQAAAQSVVPEAGCSESQTGLCVEFDISDPLAKEFLERECIHYGFVLRYPAEKQDTTHMQANNALYRYVGKEHAEKMRSFGMCLEEYAAYIAAQQ